MEFGGLGSGERPVMSELAVIAAVQRLRRLWATAFFGLFLVTGGAALSVIVGLAATGSPALTASWAVAMVVGAACLARVGRPIVLRISRAVVVDPLTEAHRPAKQVARAWRREHRAPLIYGYLSYSVVAIPGGLISAGDVVPVGFQVAGLVTTATVYHLVARHQAREAGLTLGAHPAPALALPQGGRRP